MKPYFFCPKIHLSLFFSGITRDILWFFLIVFETFIIFCFSSFLAVLLCLLACSSLLYCKIFFLLFYSTPSFRIPILCMFMPLLKQSKSVSSIPSGWHLSLYLLTYIFVFVVESVGEFWEFFQYFPAVFTPFFMLCVFITLWSENEVERITLPIEFLDKLVNRKLRSIKMAFK